MVGWHAHFGWHAQDYFEDPKVIELCKAIEANDLAKMRAVIASGADVKAIGKDGMTPLLWAFPENHFERFELLLRAGADPAVVTKSDFNTKGKLESGTTVAHETAKIRFKRQFLAVVDSGVSPDLTASYFGKPVNLFRVTLDSRLLKEAVAERIDAILRLKPSQRTLNDSVAIAINAGHYDIALRLFEAGADLESPYYLNGNPVHLVLWNELSLPRSAEVREQYNRLVEWIALQGADLEAARADVNRWRSAINHVNPEASARKQMEELKIRAKAENRETSFEYQ